MKNLGYILALTLVAPNVVGQHTRVTTPEMHCVGFISERPVPMDLYVTGTEEEGRTTFLTEGALTYVGGPAVARAKAGDAFHVVRPEGRIHDKNTNTYVGVYYRELGTIRLDVVRADGATGTVARSCAMILKGDILLPLPNKAGIHYTGPLSNRTTAPAEGGLASSILVGKDDARELAAGFFCFIGVGTREGVKVGDRFTIYRPQPAFNPKDLVNNSSHSMTTYATAQTPRYHAEIIQIMNERKLPPRVLGDLVVVDAGETTSAAKIVNSRMEIHLGDIVVRQ